MYLKLPVAKTLNYLAIKSLTCLALSLGLESVCYI